MISGESDFESRGFTDDYPADDISVQCAGETVNAVFLVTYETLLLRKVSINAPR